MWKEIIIENWHHFYSSVLNLESKKWIFRGQASKEWNITSSLFRELDRAKDLINSNGGEWEKKKNIYEKELITQLSQLQISLNALRM
ncbi:hypothetical protein ACX93W_21540 [Paenibacillus sp. CAU 1782]